MRQYRKAFELFLIAASFGVLMGLTCGCAPTDSEPAKIAVSSITLNPTSLSLQEGESATITATVSPADATDKSITWSSSNTSVATVSDGKVTAIKDGTATITASAGGKTATCEVTVTKNEVAVTGITLSQNSLTLKEGASAKLIATVLPADATDKTVTWSTSDASIATVEEGEVTGVKEGSATITAKAAEFTATCTVTVSKDVIEVTGISLNQTSLALKEGESATLTATVTPDDATDKTVTWTSSNPSVATVSEGKVTAIKEGSATITASAGGKTATCTVTVSKNDKPDSGQNEGFEFEQW